MRQTGRVFWSYCFFKSASWIVLYKVCFYSKIFRRQLSCPTRTKYYWGDLESPCHSWMDLVRSTCFDITTSFRGMAVGTGTTELREGTDCTNQSPDCWTGKPLSAKPLQSACNNSNYDKATYSGVCLSIRRNTTFVFLTFSTPCPLTAFT